MEIINQLENPNLNLEEEKIRVNFEEEVARTLEFGLRLGIGVGGFENHVRKLVSGEMEKNLGQ